MAAYFPHFALIALVAGATLLLFQKGAERKDLLAMGFAATFGVVWMFSVTMADIEVQAGRIPELWIVVSNAALAPALFFVLLAVILLERYYQPEKPMLYRHWVPLGLAALALSTAQVVNPEFYLRDIMFYEPPPGRFDPDPVQSLRFSLGPGYFLFLAILAFVVYQVARRFPSIVQAMNLPEAERRTRMLFTLAMLAAFWGVAVEILPHLLSRTAPSFLRLVGAALPLGGAIYALVLSHTFDPKAVVRTAIFYTIRISLVALPLSYWSLMRREWFADLDPRVATLTVVFTVMVLDFVILRLKPLLDRIALRKTYNSIEAVNRLVRELLTLRDLRGLTETVSDFLYETLGARDIAVWMPVAHDHDALHNPITDARLSLPRDKRAPLAARRKSMTQGDFQMDPRLHPVREELERIFDNLNIEVLLPLTDGRKFVGLVTFGIKESLDEYYDQDLQFLDRLGEPLALSLKNASMYELAKSGKPAAVLSREELESLLESHWEKARRHDEVLSLVLFRMAEADAMDEELGSGAAAAFLSLLGEKLRPTLRAFDIPGRYHEHILAVFMPQTPLAGAEIGGRRIRSWLEETEIEINGHVKRTRFDLAAASRTEEMTGPEDLLRAAVEALEDSTALIPR